VLEWLACIRAPANPPLRALDVAMGRGRHVLALASAGWRAFGVDQRLDAVRDAHEKARAAGVAISAWVADLTAAPLPRSAFDLIVVTRYLQRDLFPALRETLKPGGFVVYETFTIRQRERGTGPTSAAYLLEEGELEGYFDGFDVLFYEETLSPEAVARLVARKPSS
jgi:SAM-dependent methyltransferase